MKVIRKSFLLLLSLLYVRKKSGLRGEEGYENGAKAQKDVMIDKMRGSNERGGWRQEPNLWRFPGGVLVNTPLRYQSQGFGCKKRVRDDSRPGWWEYQSGK